MRLISNWVGRNFATAILCAAGVATSSHTVVGQTATNKEAVVVKKLPIGLAPDAGTDAGAMHKYEVAIRQLLLEQKFDDLDRIGDEDRQTKSKFAGGVWKLYIFYQGLKLPAEGRNAPDEVWKNHLSILTAWADAKRESITARVALAEALLNYTAKLQDAADNRTIEQAKNAPDAWPQIRQVQHLGDLVLKDAAALPTKCPHYYFVKLEIEEMRDKDGGRAQFEEAIAYEPTYYPYYRLHALYQRPEWDGDEGLAEKFADEISRKVGGKQGAAIYFEIAAALNCSPSTRHLMKVLLPWDRVREGYAALEELHGRSLYKMNQFAYLAVRYEQLDAAVKMLKDIGENGDEFTWGSMKYFEYMRSWAMAPPEIEALRDKSEANAATAEGQKYQLQIKNEIGSKFIPTIRQCMKPPTKGPSEGWDLFFRIGGKGEIEEVKSWPKTTFTECVLPGFKGTLSPPPTASSYWVKLSSPPFIGFE